MWFVFQPPLKNLPNPRRIRAKWSWGWKNWKKKHRRPRSLKKNEKLLHSITAVLIERERIDGEEFEKPFKGEELPPIVVEEPEESEEKEKPEEAEEPEKAEIVVCTAEETIEESVNKIIRTLELMGHVPASETELEYSEAEEEEIKKRLADLGYI